MIQTDAIARIQQLWRMRQRWHRAEKSLILQGKAVCRSWMDGDKDKASELFDLAKRGENTDDVLAMALSPFLAAMEQFAPMRRSIEKELKKTAKLLPIYEWVKEVKGFGELNLAALVGECGDVGSYRSHSALWKRMGLAVIGGERQRKKADAEEALAHGYNPPRRAVAFLLGDTIIKGNRDGIYRTLYLERKAFELARDPDMSPMHAHRRAQRYMEKRLLKHLWQAWRRASTKASERTVFQMPAAEITPQGVGEAVCPVPALAIHQMPPHQSSEGDSHVDA